VLEQSRVTGCTVVPREVLEHPGSTTVPRVSARVRESILKVPWYIGECLSARECLKKCSSTKRVHRKSG